MLDPKLDAKVDALLAKMTLDEKIGQMNQIPSVSEKHVDLIRKGAIGSSCLATTAWAGNDPQDAVDVERLNVLQKIAVEQSRLGIPLLFGRDVIHGYRTVAPIPLGQAATFAPSLVEQAARVAAREAASCGVRWVFTPMLDIARDPRWGRVAEGFGEDPCLASAMARAAVRGYQGDDLSDPERVVACGKHYVGYGGAEGGRDYDTVELSENTLRNVHLRPFHAAVQAGLGTIMSAFHEIGGVPISANRRLLTEILKEEWCFDGFVVSDWNAVAELCEHGVAGSRKDAAALAVGAGVDMDMVSDSYVRTLAELVREGRVVETVIDAAVRRILRIKLRLGLFERPYADTARPASVLLAPDHLECVRDLARKSIVLLKNERGLLPLRKNAALLATGPMLQAKGELFGCWTLDGNPADVVSILDGIRSKVAPGADLTVVTSSDEAMLHATTAPITIVAVGEHPCRTGEAHSTSTLDLPPGQLEMLQALHTMGTKLVVVVLGGRPLSIGWLAEHADAVLMAWHPGVQGGQAIADILFGDESPSGRLPITFPRTVGQVPIYYNHKPTGRPVPDAGRVWSRYTDARTGPLYPFGFGLSYTTFEYRDLTIVPQKIRRGETATVSVEIANTGERAAEETAQLYLRDQVASVTRPIKELAAFARVALAPGETKRVSFTLGSDELSFYGADNRRIVEPGEITVWVGPSSATGLAATLMVE